MRDMNSQHPWFDDGDLVLHLPGMSFDQRKQIFTDFLNPINFDENTGTRLVDGVASFQNDLHDWRVRPGLWEQYRGAGWNIPCREMFDRYPKFRTAK